MAEHSELVSEMAILEKLGTQERLKMAKKRRLQQLKKWNQREKEFNNLKKNNKKIDLNGEENDKNENKKRRKIDNVHFVSSVMLLEAAARNDIDEVRRLLTIGVNPDSTNEDGLTALHQCCIDDSEEMMKLLIEFNANVNAKDSEQWTPLHAAATCGHLHLVRYLIERGANLLAVNADNNMPYDICEHEETLDYIEQQMASRGISQQQIDETRAQTEMEMLDFLKQQLQNGIDLNTIRFDYNASALHIAAANGYIQVVEFLLENNFQINVDDNDNWQPIHAAACWGHPDVLEILAQAGADLDARTKNNETLYDICEDLELKEQIEQLKNEMETKQQQLLQQQSLNGSRLKRSHSQNTRSQSVRRTSIREKNNTSRREAREEAKIRHHLDDEPKTLTADANKLKSHQQSQQQTNSASSLKSAAQHLPNNLGLTNVTSINNVTNVTNINQSSYNQHLNQFNQNQNSLNIPLNSSSYAQTDHHQNKQQNLIFKDNTNFKDTSLMRESKDSQQQKQIKLNDQLDSKLKLEIHLSANQQANGHNNQIASNQLNNLNNYPTNCSNVSTLSDLKKYRNDLRHRNHFNAEFKDAMITNNEQIMHKNKSSTASGTGKFNEQMVDGLVHRFDNQNSDLKLKFKGDPSDMIGEIKNKKCCSMM